MKRRRETARDVPEEEDDGDWGPEDELAAGEEGDAADGSKRPACIVCVCV